jgi:dUTP pyrophosphatase
MSELTSLRVRVRRLPHAADLPLPAYASADAAGLDLLAAVDGERVLAPGARTLIPTGIALVIPPGFEGQIRPRSGLALEHGVTVLNAPGTVDADYRGEVGVVLINLGEAPVTIVRGMRIAQLVVAPHCFVAWDDRTAGGEPLAPTPRGAGGFGSTG